MNQRAEQGVESPAVTLPFGVALRYWLRLGCISFGGPAGQIAIMHAELVEKRRWISEQRFLHALNYCMVLPGPEAQQLATYIGWLLHGVRGGVAAGALFVLPSLALLMLLSWIYVAYGHQPLVAGAFDGVKPVVVAVIVCAVLRIGSRAIKTWFALLVSAGSFVANGVFGVPFPAIVGAAAVVGCLTGWLRPNLLGKPGGHGGQTKAGNAPRTPALIDDDHPSPAHARPSWSRFSWQLAAGMLLWILPMAALRERFGWSGTPTQMGWFFTQAALLTFGGAYAVLPFVTEQAVSAHWLQPPQMIDGLALGETTPGPLIMIVSFVGFVGGWQSGLGPAGAIGCCLVATYFTFLPSFLFILLGGPFIESMRGQLGLHSVLTAITAAVVGVILQLAVFFGRSALLEADYSPRWLSIVIALAAFAALYRYKIEIVRVVLGAAALGVATAVAR